ncbi:MAG: hypothetical protein ACRELF_07355 [Gemmataceae bacterium]
MSAILVCPDCDQKLRVPETARGKSFRCPACKALISFESEPDGPTPSRSVKTTPSPRTAAAPSRGRPRRDEEPEDDIEPAAKEPIRRKSSRSRPIRDKSSAGLIIGLVVGGVMLLLVLVGGGGTLIWLVMRTSGKGISEAEWQTFTPPNSDCSVLMPGTPQPQPMTSLGITINKYLLTRTREKEFFVVAYANFGPDPLQPNALEIGVNAEREHLLRTLKGKAASETPITLGALPGREFQLAIQPKGILIERMYLAKVNGIHRIYLVVAAGDNMTANHPDATRFFASFKINGTVLPPTFVGAAAPGWPNPPIFVNPPPANPGFNPPRGITRPRLPRGPRP